MTLNESSPLQEYPAPLFPMDNPPIITPETEPLTQTSTLKIYLHLAEPVLFLQGYDLAVASSKLPGLLRGSLIIRVLKPTKVKGISMLLRGTSRTEWPEGIPPRHTEMIDEFDFLKHGWGFWSTGDEGYGADLVRALPDDEFDEEETTISNSALNLLRRVGSPSPSRGEGSGRQRSNSVISSFSLPGISSTTSMHAAPTSTPERDSNGNITFPPGEYLYCFEHPIPSSFPESVDCGYGSVKYNLQISLERPGAFKSNIYTNKELKVVRLHCDDSVEDAEPISISRDWEGLLFYDLVVFSKTIVLNAFMPMSFCLRPAEKIKLHRIRVYLTESADFYSKSKKAHRSLNSKKILLMEKKAPPPPDLPPNADAKARKQGNLLSTDGYDLCAKEFDFMVYIPEFYAPGTNISPNILNSHIKIHHWIKICLRLSRIVNGKPKHYEISIDSPIHVMHPLASHANTLLPSYNGMSMYEMTEGGTNHKSNTYFPNNVINQPPISPEGSLLNQRRDETKINGFYDSIQQSHSIGNSKLLPNKPLRYQTSMHPCAEPEYSTNHYLDRELIITVSENIKNNIYKPENLDMRLTSPQAIPLSPVNSPVPLPPLSYDNTIDHDFEVQPPSFEEVSAIYPRSSAQVLGSPPDPTRVRTTSFSDRSRRGSDGSILGFTAPPLPHSLHEHGTLAPTIRQQLLAVSPGPYHLNNIHYDVMSLHSVGSGNTVGGFGGIDSIMNNNSSDNNEAGSDVVGSSYEADMRGRSADVRSLINYTSLSPRPETLNIIGVDGLPLNPPSYAEILIDESRSRLLDGVEGSFIPRIDIVRASESPVSRSNDNEVADDDITAGFEFTGGSTTMPASILRSTSPTAQRLRSSHRSRASSPRGSIDISRGIGDTMFGDGLARHTQEQDPFGNNDVGETDLISRVSSISPCNSLDHLQNEPGVHRIVDNNHLIDDTIATTPLLPTSSQFSSGLIRSSTPSNILLPYPYENLSQESFEMDRRESYSVDITALYSQTSPRDLSFQGNGLSLNGSTSTEEALLDFNNHISRLSDESRQSSNSEGFSSSDLTLHTTDTTLCTREEDITTTLLRLKHPDEVRTDNNRAKKRNQDF